MAPGLASGLTRAVFSPRRPDAPDSVCARLMAFSSLVSISPADVITAPSCSSTLSLSAALRLPQAPLRQQFALIAPHLAGLDLFVFDQSGLGDAAAELLPKTPPHMGVCLV